MKERTELRWPKNVLSLMMAFALLLLPVLWGCQGASPSGDSETTEGVESAGEEEQEQPETERDTWARDCLDRHDEVTVYALSTLSGAQVERLMDQHSYKWNTRNQCWFKDKGTSAVVVYDSEGHTLTNEQIAELGTGISEKDVSYRIASSHYSTVKRAFDGLVSGGMTCVDVELTDQSGVAVVADGAGARGLVFLHGEEDAISVTFMSEQAVSSGLFDDLAGQSVGTTIDEAFEALAGRRPGAQDAS